MTTGPDIPAEFEPSLLDPKDWDEFRRQAHELLDACISRMATARDHPWRPVDSKVAGKFRLDSSEPGIGYGDLVSILVQSVLPYGTGNTHPRFFGWVHGTGLAAGLLAEIVAATMNSNCGGRDHGAIYVEREVIRWCAEIFGFPANCSGVLVTGSSQATVIALAAARYRALGRRVRAEGLHDAPRVAAYAAEGAHSAIVKALELLGLGSTSLRAIPVGEEGGIDLTHLSAAVERDRAAGVQPFCVIGTAGSVDRGAFDNLEDLAGLCQREALWFHVDGAFGAWARLADDPWRGLTRGIELADSLAFDFHKWMYVQYDCGAVLIRDEAVHRAAFASRPSYLASQSHGLGGGEPWYCDYGIDLSRGFRALKVWAAIRAHGRSALGAAISRNCELAAQMGRWTASSDDLTLAAPVQLNVCCFSAAPSDMDAASSDALNSGIAQQLQMDGDVVFSTVKVDDRTVIRAAITNHRTCSADILYAIEAVRRVRDQALREWPAKSFL
jgi:glutamate/tyrosine decarboxylase-like PLP-dependent enzyme